MRACVAERARATGLHWGWLTIPARNSSNLHAWALGVTGFESAMFLCLKVRETRRRDTAAQMHLTIILVSVIPVQCSARSDCESANYFYLTIQVLVQMFIAKCLFSAKMFFRKFIFAYPA